MVMAQVGPQESEKNVFGYFRKILEKRFFFLLLLMLHSKREIFNKNIKILVKSGFVSL